MKIIDELNSAIRSRIVLHRSPSVIILNPGTWMTIVCSSASRGLASVFPQDSPKYMDIPIVRSLDIQPGEFKIY